MTHVIYYCEGLGTYNYVKLTPRVAKTDRQRANLSLLVLCDRLPLSIPAHIAFDLEQWEAAHLFGGG